MKMQAEIRVLFLQAEEIPMTANHLEQGLRPGAEPPLQSSEGAVLLPPQAQTSGCEARPLRCGSAQCSVLGAAARAHRVLSAVGERAPHRCLLCGLCQRFLSPT